ncbi:MAG: hypothetical protein M5T61_20140 [Acidimicrobiia bacterium]|nr:hypothetical protein [Acidimicrobiia bacterium]
MAIDAADLGYLHVHPTDGTGRSPSASPSRPRGRYRLFFDFSVDGAGPHGRLHPDLDTDATTTPTAAADHGNTDGEGH